MSAQFSSKHHYIPKFLIKKFADEKGKVWVYNKEKKRFDKDPKSPAGVFYELNRNTFDLNGTTSDIIEKRYSKIETMLSPVLTRVLQSQTLNGTDLTWLIYLASLMKWRVPAQDDGVRKMLRSIDVQALGLKIVPEDKKLTATQQQLDEINQLDIVIELKRLLLTVQPLTEEAVIEDLFDNSFICNHHNQPALIGDTMLIEEAVSDKLGNFILPLSCDKTLICNNGISKTVPNEYFTAWKDIAVFHMSEKLVACRNKAHLQNVIEHYKMLEQMGKTHLVQEIVFRLLDPDALEDILKL
ncbi:DUF4238 domain-containing protein [Fluviicola sp.]|uniref:DUF4238 domain-containing protein n=1 Tax=Fluviicola sp. TaxID=1917219 RepID=UPI0031DEB2A9